MTLTFWQNPWIVVFFYLVWYGILIVAMFRKAVEPRTLSDTFLIIFINGFELLVLKFVLHLRARYIQDSESAPKNQYTSSLCFGLALQT